MRLTETQTSYLQAMGVDIWREQGSQLSECVSTGINLEKGSGCSNWQDLKSKVSDCTLCELHKSRTQTVFGVGDENADWLLIGEAPGSEEDKQGEPFVGRAGQLLNNMMKAVGLDRDKVYIANILKCRPPNNRDPKPEEVLCCEKYLQQQINMIQPKLILALGRVAAQNLLKLTTPIGRMRGKQFEYGETKIPVVVSYHPAYLLRSPREKQKSWQDLLTARRVYESKT